jgi:hypothetical protein
MRDLYAEIYPILNSPPDKRGWSHVTCPFCGADPQKSKPNFSYNRHGFNCYKCKAKGNLVHLATHLGLWSDSGAYTPPRTRVSSYVPPAPPSEPEPAWKNNPEAWVEKYLHDPRRYKLWMAYKPLTRATIDKHDLGVGPLPEQQMTRLIVPLYWKGACVGFKGRSLASVTNPDIPKWISARRSNVTTLFAFNYVEQGTDLLWICENYIDAALVTQMTGNAAIASGGARELTAEEIASIRRMAPKHVIMAYDNDLVGQARPELRTQLEAQWIKEQKEKGNKAVHPPQSAAIPTVDKLRRAGLEVSFFPWPDNAPTKADLLWALMQT